MLRGSCGLSTARAAVEPRACAQPHAVERKIDDGHRVEREQLAHDEPADNGDAEWAAHLDSDEVPINQYRIIRDLMKGVDRANTIITPDSGSPREQLLPFWETTAPGGYMGWGKSTQLGHGLGITMGAKLAQPGKLCVNVMGDAAFGMTTMGPAQESLDGTNPIAPGLAMDMACAMFPMYQVLRFASFRPSPTKASWST